MIFALQKYLTFIKYAQCGLLLTITHNVAGYGGGSRLGATNGHGSGGGLGGGGNQDRGGYKGKTADWRYFYPPFPENFVVLILYKIFALQNTDKYLGKGIRSRINIVGTPEIKRNVIRHFYLESSNILNNEKQTESIYSIGSCNV